MVFTCRRNARVYSSLAFVWLPVLALAAFREPLPYRIDSWHSEDGLPQSSVTAITQTRDGFLWIGTFGGLARFDGVKFKVINTSNTPRLPSNRVLSVFEDNSGALWTGTEDGLLTRSAAGQLDIFAPPIRGGVTKFIKTFVEIPNDGLWLLSAGGQLVQLRDGQFTFSSTNWGLRGATVQSIASDDSGRFWVGTDRELAIWHAGKFLSVWDQTREAGFGVEGLAVSRSGGMWVAGCGRLRRFDEGKWIADYGPFPWSKGVLSEMREDRRGQLWLGTYGSGVFRYATNGAVLNLARKEGLPGNFVRSLLEDREGNIWVGTEGHGLARVKPAIFRSYGREQGLSSDLVLTICEGQEGELWLGTNGEGIDHLKDGVVRNYGPQQGLTNECVWSVCRDRNNTLWAGTWGGGLFKMEGNRFQQLPSEQCGPVVCAMHLDSKGSLWLGQIRESPEITFLHDCQPESFKLSTKLPSVDSRAITEDRRGDIWIGTRGDGLYCLNQNHQTRFSKADGLSSEFILSLFVDREDALWIGTRQGLNLFQNGKFTVFTTSEGLPDDAIVCITEDNRGNLWCGSGIGVFRVRKEDLRNPTRAQAIRCFSYTRADGLPSLECSSGCQPAGCKTRDGRLWFPTVNGLAVVDPESVPFNPLPPPVVIDQVLIEGETQKAFFPVLSTAGAVKPGQVLPPTLRVPPGKQRFEFRYTGLSLTAPEKMRFKYKLESLENDWVQAGSERAAHYGYLRPGDYLFRVLGCNNDGVWNETGASMAVIVLPHFWQTWIFRVVVVVSLLLLFVAAYEVRLAVERRLTRMRLRMARDLHDEVGSNLGAIALLSEVLSRQTPAVGFAEELTEIRRVAAQTIDSLRDIVWFLDPAADNMNELVLRMKEAARTMLRGVAVEFNSVGETESPKPSLELRRNLFPMFKEIIYNAARHAHATHVEVLFECGPRQVRLRVQDNGIGFDEEQTRNGNGLKNLRRRAADLGGTLEIQTAPDKGTIVTLSAPVP